MIFMDRWYATRAADWINAGARHGNSANSSVAQLLSGYGVEEEE